MEYETIDLAVRNALIFGIIIGFIAGTLISLTFSKMKEYEEN